MPSTPAPANQSSEDPNKPHSGFPGATGLKYTHTIVGNNRTGGMGIRVNGKRGSLIRDLTAVAKDSEAISKRHRSDSEPTPVPVSPGALNVDPGLDKPVTSILLRRRSADASELEEAPPSSSVPKIEPFKPPFSRAAEMAERREIRMRSRFISTSNEMRSVVTRDEQQLNPEVTDDESSSGDDSSELGNDIPLDGEDVVEDDFFDPYVFEMFGALLFRLRQPK